MTLGLTKTYTPAAGEVANAANYNTDIKALFDCFAGLEGQTSTLGALTIQPTTNSTGIFLIKKADGTVIFSVDSTNRLIGIGCNVADYE